MQTIDRRRVQVVDLANSLFVHLPVSLPVCLSLYLCFEPTVVAATVLLSEFLLLSSAAGAFPGAPDRGQVLEATRDLS